MKTVSLSPYAIPQQSASYQAASWWLRAQMVAELKERDPLAWRIMCHIDNARPVRRIVSLLPATTSVEERLRRMEAALSRLILRYGLVDAHMQMEVRPTASAWPSPHAAGRPPALAPQRKPAQRTKRLVSGSRLVVAYLSLAGRTLWRIGRAGGPWVWNWMQRTWHAGALLARGRQLQARKPFTAQFRVPTRADLAQPALWQGAKTRPVRLERAPDAEPPEVEEAPKTISAHLRALTWKRQKIA
jgi:hypothetical protein